jgi:hypothetical protein
MDWIIILFWKITITTVLMINKITQKGLFIFNKLLIIFILFIIILLE